MAINTTSTTLLTKMYFPLNRSILNEKTDAEFQTRACITCFPYASLWEDALRYLNHKADPNTDF